MVQEHLGLIRHCLSSRASIDLDLDLDLASPSMASPSDYWRGDAEAGRKVKREPLAAAAAAAEDRAVARRSGSVSVPAAAAVNTITPCAACKLLRRRCAPECPFSPFFSPLEPHRFASVHRVFGASNVSKMLLELHESQRGDAASSMVYEASLRLRDPVYGCMGAILALQQQLRALEAELAAVRAEIVKHRYQQATTPPPPPPAANNVLPSSHASQLLLAAGAGRRPVGMGVVTSTVASSSSSTTAYAAAASSSTDYSSSITHDNATYFG